MEREFHRWLQAQSRQHPAVLLGVGDDAAVLDFDRQKIVVTTDTIADGTHFRLTEHTPAQIGHKAMAVNLSDLAAMAAKPVAAVLHFMLPRDFGISSAKEMFGGMQRLADRYDMTIVGGDTNTWDGPLVVGATVLGSVNQMEDAWPMTGAKPGDAIVVSGEFGGSLLGHHLDFEPAVELALGLAATNCVNAATDASDSLSADLLALAQASNCGASLQLDKIPVSAAATKMATEALGSSSTAAEISAAATQRALQDGEDFGLIMAVPQDRLKTLLLQNSDLANSLTRVGTFIDEPGLWSEAADGSRTPLQAKGYDH